MSSSYSQSQTKEEIAEGIALSVILPTFNESENILKILKSISKSIPRDFRTEVLVVDDNSPDGTAQIAEQYSQLSNGENGGQCTIRVLRRIDKIGLSSAILDGVRSSLGNNIVVMDSDFSHPPEIIPRMHHELQNPKCDIVIASRYVSGGSVSGWPLKRRLISKGATKIAQYGLGVSVQDPMSGFFAFKREIIKGIEFDAIGYKILLEILVKKKGIRIKEIPYTFKDRRVGASKLSTSTIVDYVRAVWRLYQYGRSAGEESRASVRFLSKAARFYTVGATGFAVNYLVSTLFVTILPNLWYLYATALGIGFSLTSNFFLNKLWTFEDRDLRMKKTLGQFGLFTGFSSFGILVQLSIVYSLVELYHEEYPIALIIAVTIASVSNFLLNKKWTFKEKVWG